MMQPLAPEIEALIHESLHGHLGPAERERLSAWIAESKDHARAYYLAMLDEQAIDKHIARQADAGQTGLFDPNESAAAMALAELAKLHEAGLGEPIGLQPDPPFSLHGRPSRRTRVVARLVIAGGLAAAVALSLTIALVVIALSKPQTPIAQPPEAPAERVVATLTAASDAAWADEDGDAVAIQAGESLYSGRRLKLTEGLAEITTNRGAVVILEAPCSVELLDQDNALALDAGRLVGRVDTERAKGLLVRTPHMDVTDLGTAFGVSVTEQAAHAAVFEGAVEVTAPGRTPVRLTRDQGVRLAADTPAQADWVIEQASAEISGFVRQLPQAEDRPDRVVRRVALLGTDRFRAEVIHGGVKAGAKPYRDRGYRLVGAGGQALPEALAGADLVQVPADARPGKGLRTGDLRVQITTTGPATVYLLMPPNAVPGDWLARDYQRTALHIGYTAGVDAPMTPYTVWQRREPVDGTAEVAGPVEDAMYSIAVKRVTPGPSP